MAVLIHTVRPSVVDLLIPWGLCLLLLLLRPEDRPSIFCTCIVDRTVLIACHLKVRLLSPNKYTRQDCITSSMKGKK
jgi:hypothetical protein